MSVWTKVQTRTSLPIVVLLFLKRALVTIFVRPLVCFFDVKWLSLNLELVFVKFMMKLLSTIFYSTILYIYVFNNSISYTTFFDDQKFVTHLFFFAMNHVEKKSKQQSSPPLYYIKKYHIMKKEKKNHCTILIMLFLNSIDKAQSYT